MNKNLKSFVVLGLLAGLACVWAWFSTQYFQVTFYGYDFEVVSPRSGSWTNMPLTAVSVNLDSGKVYPEVYRPDADSEVLSADTADKYARETFSFPIPKGKHRHELVYVGNAECGGSFEFHAQSQDKIALVVKGKLDCRLSDNAVVQFAQEALKEGSYAKNTEVCVPNEFTRACDHVVGNISIVELQSKKVPFSRDFKNWVKWSNSAITLPFSAADAIGALTPNQLKIEAAIKEELERRSNRQAVLRVHVTTITRLMPLTVHTIVGGMD